MRYLLLFFGLTMAEILVSQITPVIEGPSSEYRGWEQGALSWDDFRGEPQYRLGYNSNLVYRMFLDEEPTESGDTIVFRPRPKLTLLRESSWATLDARTEQELAYLQLCWDIMELHRRYILSEMDEMLAKDIEGLSFAAIVEDGQRRIARFSAETQRGRDVEALSVWRSRVDEELREHSVDSELWIRHSLNNFSISYGYATSLRGGDLGRLFGMAHHLHIGFHYARPRWLLNSNILVGSARILSPVLGSDGPWDMRRRALDARMDLQLGYVLPYEKFHLAPFVSRGFQALSISEEIGEDEYQGYELNDGYWAIGLELLWKYRHVRDLKANRVKLLSKAELRTSSVRLSASLAPVRIDGRRGWQSMLGLSIDFASKRIHIE